MAILYPEYQICEKMIPKPEEGELHIMKFLAENLDDNYEVFFQPYLNGDRPDIIVLRKDSGILIIEVKDWDLNFYSINNQGHWFVRDQAQNRDIRIKSPFDQVNQYHQNIFSLHIEELLDRKILNPSYFATVSCLVYFHKGEQPFVKNMLTVSNMHEEAKKPLNHTEVLCRNTLNRDNLNEILREKYLDRKSKLFDEKIYLSVKRFLQPPSHLTEQGKEIIYSKEQNSLIISKPGMQKIKGVAGCGKTLVMAKRAVNAYLRTKEPVLILSYNITLRNYIHDRVSEVREKYEWKNFEILHYHLFFKSQANNNDLQYNSFKDYDNVDFFEMVNFKLPKYSAIFIDEGQDYNYEWYVILKNYFLKDNGEFVIFADEKQNIYERLLDSDKKVKTNIPGRWNEQLKSTRRLSKSVTQLANQFQKEFWLEKYEFDDIIYENSQGDLFREEFIDYIFMDETTNTKTILEFIYKKIFAHNIHPNDIGILSPEVTLIRDLDNKINKIKKEKTSTMFETQEMYENVLSAFQKDGLKGDKLKSRMKKTLDELRRSKKFNFRMNPGTIKLSTIHSFKGWEINTLFLIISSNSEEKISLDELIYTGITRARRNLFIINLGVKKYDNFFKKEVYLLNKE